MGGETLEYLESCDPDGELFNEYGDDWESHICDDEPEDDDFE